MHEREFALRVLNRLLPEEFAPLQTDSINEPGLGFTAFKRRVWRKYQHTAFHAEIDSHLELVAEYLRTNGERGINRLIINMPPRYGKTKSVSHHFPAWVLGQMPDIPIILTSYGSSLAWRNSRSVRNLIKREEYHEIYPHVGLSGDKKAAQEWMLRHYDGGMIAAGVGGAITGSGGRLIIIDDPTKSRAEAESETYRERLKDWYQNDLYTRLEEPGAIILMNTRWHYDDLAGWLLGDNVDNWTVLSLPAIAEESDPLGRQPGEPLWPERHSAEKLARIAEQMGDYAFSALFQQKPRMGRGTLFKPLEISTVDEAPDIVETVRFYDLAITEKQRASYTVGLKLGRKADGRLVVLDVWRIQQESPEVHRGIIQNALRDGSGVRLRLEAEKAGLVEWQNLMRDPDLHGYTIEAEPPQGDKYTRATPIAMRVNAGLVEMVKAPWNRSFIEELAVFPNGSANDQVDALSGAYKMFEKKAVGLVFSDWGIENLDPALTYNPTQLLLWGCVDGYEEGYGKGTDTYRPRVALIGQANADGGLNILDEYVVTGEGNYNDTINNLLSLGELHGWGKPKSPAAAYIAAEEDAFKGALWKRGISTIGSTHPQAEGIRNIRRMIKTSQGERLLKVHPRCQYLLYELENHRYDPDRKSGSGEPVPTEFNNRAIRALMLMAWHLRYG